MKKIVRIILSLPKTLYYNIKLFGIKEGLKLPLFVSYRYKILARRGDIFVSDKNKKFIVKFGLNEGSVAVPVLHNGVISVKRGGKIQFEGSADFKLGCCCVVSKAGKLTFGDGFTCNKNCSFSVDAPVSIGEDALLGWNVKIRTSDGHPIYKLVKEADSPMNPAREVKIGRHVWIAAEVDILKGVSVPDNCVVGYRSCLTKSIEKENCIIAGYPGKIVKENIMWRRDE